MTLTLLTVPISVGDFIDRLSILTIKNNKDLPVSDELEQYEQQFTELSAYSRLHYLEMFLAINVQLWGLEDRKRSKLLEVGSEEYVEVSELITHLNDLRFQIKKSADKYFGSAISEKKSHE
jgi:hypothetical protein